MSNGLENGFMLTVTTAVVSLGRTVRLHMLLDFKVRPYFDAVSGALFAISALLAGAFVPSSAAAQTGEPVKIGYSMSLTGGLAPNGRSGLLAQKIWEVLPRHSLAAKENTVILPPANARTRSRWCVNTLLMSTMKPCPRA